MPSRQGRMGLANYDTWGTAALCCDHWAYMLCLYQHSEIHWTATAWADCRGNGIKVDNMWVSIESIRRLWGVP